MKMRKSYQRSFNKVMRQLNQNMQSDDLWKGRFEFRQINVKFERFEDNSGGVLSVCVRAYDKLTNYYKDYWIDYMPYYHLSKTDVYGMANTFITRDARVWECSSKDQLRPATAPDFRNVKVLDEVWKNKEYNWYKEYEIND